jgi:extracellular elastinolytic metalloproteinase
MTAIGEVWANMLHNVYAALVAEHGWDANFRVDPTVKAGNAVFLHLFMDALLLQPCNPDCEYLLFRFSDVCLTPPTVVAARAAWIQVDANRYAGANKCLLWKAFASRGLGVGAADYVDSSAVPEECSGTSLSSSTATSTSTSSSSPTVTSSTTSPTKS